jgi:hypothetical protein
MAEDFLRRWSRLKHQSEEPAQPPVEKPEQAPAPLPPVDKLTLESDFTGFMQPKVDGLLRRAALKKLFGDPHFNIPDPFEAYSGDWTGGEPIPAELLATLNQARTLLFDKAEAEPAEEMKPEGEPKPDEPGRQGA